MNTTFQRILCTGVTAFTLMLSGGARASDTKPLVIAISAEYGVQGSHAAQSIEKGVRLAADEINAVGGVLGRKLEMLIRDDRGVPARAVDNVIELAAKPEVVAVFCGRFSPVAMELVPVANREKILLLDPWAAADGITSNPENSYVFRLSLTDSWAIEKMMKYARSRNLQQLGVLVPNTAWGRSSLAAANNFRANNSGFQVTPLWYNWGDTEFTGLLQKVRIDGIQALIMVANEAEGSHIVRQMAALPKEQRMPIISHWGIAGGDFAALVGNALHDVDLTVVQTFSLNSPPNKVAKKVIAAYESKFNESIHTLRAQVGFAHAYDFTHLLAKAIRQANSADRRVIRAALEKLGTHEGLVRTYQKPFGPNDHEGLDASQVSMMRFAPNGGFQEIRP